MDQVISNEFILRAENALKFHSKSYVITKKAVISYLSNFVSATFYKNANFL